MKGSIVICFIWMGFLLAISFFEAPLKFLAPSLSISQGVEIGRIIFFWMNKLELLFLVIILLFSWKSKACIMKSVLVLTTVMAVESLWLLPCLDILAHNYVLNQIEGNPIYHQLYVGCEVIKLISLISFGRCQLQKL